MRWINLVKKITVNIISFVVKTVKKISKKIKPYMTPTMIISFGIAWYITNGWAYTLLGIGLYSNITWMKAIGTSYIAILWLPCTPEKFLTFPLAFFIQKKIFGIKQKEDLKEFALMQLDKTN